MRSDPRQRRLPIIIGVRELRRERSAKRDETVAMRVPELIGTWLEFQSRARGKTKSNLMREILMQRIEEEQSGKPLSAFANICENDRQIILRAAELIGRFAAMVSRRTA
jgi:predicted DNA-binding protein